MSRKLEVIIIGFIFVLTSLVMASPADKYTSADYFKLLKRAKAQDPKLNFTALRLSYTKTKLYEPDYEVKNIIEVKNAFESEEWNKAISIAGEIFKGNYQNIDAHYFCMLSYQELQDKKKEELHRYMYNGLLQSVMNSGGGKGDTPQNAFVVISILEEYSVFRALEVSPYKEEVIKVGGSLYDKWQVKHPRTGKKIIYFNIDLLANTIQKKSIFHNEK